VHRDILTFRWPCIVIYWRSGDRASWYIDVQVTVHPDVFLELNQRDALISQTYFWNKSLYVSGSSYVHQQEFFTVHTAMVYVIQVCWQLAGRIKMELSSILMYTRHVEHDQGGRKFTVFIILHLHILLGYKFIAAYNTCRWKIHTVSFLGEFQNYESDYYLPRVCASFRMVNLGSHGKYFHEILYLTIFQKSAEKIQVSLQSGNNNGYFTWRPIYIFDHISLNSSKNEKISSSNYVANQNTHFMSTSVLGISAVYEIVWKNIVEPDRPQMKIWCMHITCWIPKTKNTHTQNI